MYCTAIEEMDRVRRAWNDRTSSRGIGGGQAFDEGFGHFSVYKRDPYNPYSGN